MDEVIDYVMNTPGNTNPNVLRGILQNNEGGGGTMYVTVDEETGVLSKNYAEIASAVENGQFVALRWPDGETIENICPLFRYNGNDDPDKGSVSFGAMFMGYRNSNGNLTLTPILFLNEESATAPLVIFGD